MSEGRPPGRPLFALENRREQASLSAVPRWCIQPATRMTRLDVYVRHREMGGHKLVPTRDHERIRNWAARHGAVPAEIRRLKFDGDPSILYFLFGNAASGTPELLPISWEDFFARFDLLGLSMAWHEYLPAFDIVHVKKSSEAHLQN